MDKYLKKERRLKLVLVSIIFILSALVLFTVKNMLVSFILAFVISYLMTPSVLYIERKLVNRFTAVILVFVSSIILITLFGLILIPFISDQLNSLQIEIPKYTQGVTEMIAKTENRLNNFLKSFYHIGISTKFNTYMGSWTESVIGEIPNFASQILTVSLLTPVFAFFMLKDGKRITKEILKIVPNNLFEFSLDLSHQINEQIGGFIRARLLESAIVGMVVFVGLFILNVPYSPFLAIFAALTNLIPYVGPIIGAIPAVLVVIVNHDPAFAVLLVGSVYLVAQLIDIMFIIPLVLARNVNLHPVTVIIVIIVGSQLMGILGMIISIPITATLKLTSIAVYEHLIGFRV